KLKKRVKKLERKKKSRTPQPKRKVYKPSVESSEEILGQKDASKQGRNSDKTKELNVDEDEHMFDLSDLADSIEVRIDVDAQLIERLQAKEREQMFVEEQARLLMEFNSAIKKFFAAKRAEEQSNKPPTKAEQRKKISGKKVDSSGKKAENSKKRTRAVLGEESVKRQKVEDDAKKAELKACLEIVLDDDSAADGSTKYYKVFSAMLNDFDRQDVLDQYRLVKERFETTSPEGYNRLLWGDLITLFEPSTEDEI
ncbi:hypothetical protein Tco_1579883, partial [Tanacetum coccineum]